MCKGGCPAIIFFGSFRPPDKVATKKTPPPPLRYRGLRDLRAATWNKWDQVVATGGIDEGETYIDEVKCGLLNMIYDLLIGVSL